MDASSFYEVALTWVTDQVLLLRPIVTLGTTAALFFVVALLAGHWRTRRLRAELLTLKTRVAALEAAENCRLLESLNRRPLDLNMTGLLTAPEDETMFPIAPNIAPPDVTAQGGALNRWRESSLKHPGSADREQQPPSS